MSKAIGPAGASASGARTRARATALAGLLLAAAALAGAGGCVKLGHEAPQPDYYLLSLELPAGPPASGRGGTTAAPDGSGPAAGPVLLVRPIAADPPFDRREFLYRSGDNRWQRDYYNRFLAAPGEMVTEATRRRLSGSGLFGGVVGLDAPVRPDYVLQGALRAIYGDYRGDRREAVMEIEFSLAAPGRAAGVVGGGAGGIAGDGAGGGPDGGPLLARSYPARVRLGGTSGPELVAGLDSTLAVILRDLDRDLRGVVGPREPPPSR